MKESMKDAVKRVMKKAVDEQFVAGVSLLVLQDGDEVLYEQEGYRDLENRVPMSRDTICRLYSMTKPITAAAVMMLVERGMIDLADSIETYFPSFRQLRTEENGKIVTAKRGILIKDLMNMTSGCLYPGNQTVAECEAAALFDRIDERLYSSNPMSTMEIVKQIGKLPTAFHPGTHWKYGTSADVLGGLVEKVSGMKFGEFLKKEFFEPLGMNDTGFYVPDSKRERLSKVYEETKQGLREYKTNHLGIRYEADTEPAFESGGAGLFSTLDDYAGFATMLLNEGRYNKVNILKPATVSYMTQAQLMPWQQYDIDTGWESLQGYTYGNLLRIMKNPGQAWQLTTVGEYGWDGWLGAYFCNSPKDNLSMLLFMQKRDSGTTKLTRELKNIVFGNLKKSSD